MAHSLRRSSVSASAEKSILTALIVSTQFNYEVAHLINFDYFTNSFIKTVVKWCIDFFDAYEKAPFNHIQDIFNDKKNTIKEGDSELIEKLLTDISSRYELDSGLNIDYSVEQALKFFRTRELEIAHGNIGICLGKNDIDGAEEQINNYTKVARLTSGWINPFDEQYVDDVFAHSERMFMLPGELGKFLGGFDSGWLIAVAAGFKKGKSLSLQEILVAAIFQRLKVAWFSLEMNKVVSNDRFYKRLIGAETAEGGSAIYPCFDCTYNQDGTCKKKERVNRIQLIKKSGKPDFNSSSNYKPCTVCRFTEPKDYSVAWWYESIDRPGYTPENVKKYLNALRKQLNKSYRFKAYPKFGAGLSDMRRDLDLLERSEGFVPHVIIVDQANGVKPEYGDPSGTSSHDEVWKGLAGLSSERSALVVSPTQITRGALDKKTAKQGDVASWIGLLGHIDAAYTLNQSDQEKAEGIMRYSTMIHRHDDYNESSTCVVLQNPKFGQFYLDAHIMR